MAQQPSTPRDLTCRDLDEDTDHQVILFPTSVGALVRAHKPIPSSGPTVARARARISTRLIRQVVVLKVDGPLSGTEDLDYAVQMSLAGQPRGVVCDLSAAAAQDGPPVLVKALATAGRHVRDWPAIPVAFVCPTPRVRAALRAHPLGKHLIVTDSLFSAVSQVLAGTEPATESLRLAPHPTAPRAARNFTTRTLLDWQLNRTIPFASLVVSELVTSALVHAGTDIDLTLTWHPHALRITVADHGAAPQGPTHDNGLHGRGLTVVSGLSRACGVLPTTRGGKLLWAVLEPPEPRRPRTPTDKVTASLTTLWQGAPAPVVAPPRTSGNPET